MKIILSPLVAALHGRAAHAVCAVTKGVQYVKKYGRPSGRPSAAQLAHRSHMERMARWWRSLPVNVRAFITSLADAEGITGFAMFTRTMASMHSISYDCTIIGDNPSLQHIYELECRPPMYQNQLPVRWKKMNAIPTYYVHFFHMLVVREPSETTWEDVITYRPDLTCLVSNEFQVINQLASHTEYWIVGCVAKLQNMPDNTVFSGGYADIGTTKS